MRHFLTKLQSDAECEDVSRVSRNTSRHGLLRLQRHISTMLSLGEDPEVNGLTFGKIIIRSLNPHARALSLLSTSLHSILLHFTAALLHSNHSLPSSLHISHHSISSTCYTSSSANPRTHTTNLYYCTAGSDFSH